MNPIKSFHDFRMLLARNFRVLFADGLGLLLTICLAPLISALVVITFWQINRDAESNDNLVLSAQILFDSVHILREENPTGTRPAPALPSYPAKDAKSAINDFCADFYLFKSLYGREKGKYDANECTQEATKYWTQKDQSIQTAFSLHDFSLFRYNLVNPGPSTKTLWKNAEYLWPKEGARTYEVKVKANEPPSDPPEWWPRNDKLEPLTPRELLVRRHEEMRKHRKGLVGEESARLHLTVFFILVSAAIWMGLLPGCREIVSEWEVFVRENRILYACLPYVMAKFVMLGVLACFQNMLLVLSIGCFFHFPQIHMWGLYLVLCLTSFAAIALSLLVSSFTTTLRAALTIAPIIMIAQVIQGGLLRLPSQDSSDNTWYNNVCRKCIQKSIQQYCAFEAVTGILARLPQEERELPPEMLPSTEEEEDIHTLKHLLEDAKHQGEELIVPEISILKKPKGILDSDEDTVSEFLECSTSKLDDYVFGKGRFRPFVIGGLFRWIASRFVAHGWLEQKDVSGASYHVLRPCLWLIVQCVVLLFLSCLWLRFRIFFSRQRGRLAAKFGIAPKR